MLPYRPPRDLLERWFPGRDVRVVARLPGGYLNDVYQVEDDEGGTYALRIAPAGACEETLLWEHELLVHLAPRLSEVLAPLAAPDGETYIEYEGRLTTLWPFVEGEAAVRFRRAHRVAAAHSLARIHHATAAYPFSVARPGVPAWHHLDWHENRWWSWSRARAALAATHEAPDDVDTAEIVEAVERALELLPVTLHELARHDLPEQPVHGDFWAGNLRVEGDRVVGVFDWDEARLDWRVTEVADATWEFSCYPHHEDFDPVVAREFIDAYLEAGGVLGDEERSLIVLLMRVRRLWGALYQVGEWQRGEEIDWYHLRSSARALDRLADRDGV